MAARKQCSVCSSGNPSEIHHSRIEKSTIEGELNFFFSVDMREFLSYRGEDDNNISKPEFKKHPGSRKLAEASRKTGVSAEQDNEADNFRASGISKTEFEKLQGNKKFAEALREMNVSLEQNSEADRLRVNGFNNGVFGGVLTKRWLNFPTYRIEGEENEEWFLRCSWLGLFEVHLKKTLRKNDNFVTVIDQILAYRSRFFDNSGNQEIDETDIWYKVFTNINKFCAQVNEFKYENIEFKSIPLSNRISFTQRQRYGIVLAKKINCSECKKRLPARILCKNNLLPSLLYSSLVTDLETDESKQQEDQTNVPDLSSDEITNLSTWTDEICAFGSERGFIYYDPNIRVKEHQDSYDYDDYWKYIMRGVQHTVSVRATLRSLQTQIKKLTDKLPELITAIDDSSPGQKIKGGKNTTEAATIDEDLAHSLANILQTMPQVNNVCIPSIAFKANYAVDKFRYLNDQCFGFKDLLTALRRDIRDVSAFLEFYKQYQLQVGLQERREIEWRKNDIANQQLVLDKEQDKKKDQFHLWIAITAILVVAPTAVNDGAIVMAKYYPPHEESKSPDYILHSTLIYVVLILLLVLFRQIQTREREKEIHIFRKELADRTNKV